MTMDDARSDRDGFAERVFASSLGYFDILSIHLGLRLGLYRALADRGAMTSDELADAAGIDERYAREWLEQQATRAIVRADLGADPTRFTLPPGHAEVLLDGDSLSFMGASIGQLMSLPAAIGAVQGAFRSGEGVPYEAYGKEGVEGQGASNRPTFLTTLPQEWLPAIDAIHERLSAGPARVVDVGCGTGWSSIAIAHAYPSVQVDGFDPDEISIQMARDHALEAGVADRVRFHREDAAELTRHGPFDVATAFECIHDMARPVEVLGAVREALADDGAMLIVDERTKDAFSGEPDDREAYFYGWSIFDCLPSGMYEQPSAGTGTVMRASTLHRYADEAGFTRFDVLPIEHDAFRLYLLRP
ncbi:MAG: methyltransferase domain-containing protein [Actinobacteria bacterium]|nr:MAG: methyltransferase domain-containing protein [Actinomycetota bacterium]